MRTLRIQGFSRYLDAPPGWKDEGKECGYHALVIAGPTIVCSSRIAWEPEPHELAALAAGAPVYLTVCGIVHPPVAIKVGRPPE